MSVFKCIFTCLSWLAVEIVRLCVVANYNDVKATRWFMNAFSSHSLSQFAPYIL